MSLTAGEVLFAVAAGLGAGLLLGRLLGSDSFIPNKATKDYTARKKDGEILTLASGDSFGHTMAPKDYFRKGAKRKKDYAWPDGYKYPLYFWKSSGELDIEKSKNHVRSAQSYFSRYKKRYPMKVRRTIARNINRAKKKFHIGGKTVKP